MSYWEHGTACHFYLSLTIYHASLPLLTMHSHAPLPVPRFHTCRGMSEFNVFISYLQRWYYQRKTSAGCLLWCRRGIHLLRQSSPSLYICAFTIDDHRKIANTNSSTARPGSPCLLTSSGSPLLLFSARTHSVVVDGFHPCKEVTQPSVLWTHHASTHACYLMLIASMA